MIAQSSTCCQATSGFDPPPWDPTEKRLSVHYLYTVWWLATFPGLCVLGTALTVNVLLIAVTGRNRESDIVETWRIGFDCLVGTPVAGNTLAQLIRTGQI
jgi:hypothetical protein